MRNNKLNGVQFIIILFKYERVEKMRKLKAIRSALGYSYINFAKFFGVSTNTIHQWEKGNSTPRHEHLMKLYELTGIDSNLFYRDDVNIKIDHLDNTINDYTLPRGIELFTTHPRILYYGKKLCLEIGNHEGFITSFYSGSYLVTMEADNPDTDKWTTIGTHITHLAATKHNYEDGNYYKLFAMIYTEKQGYDFYEIFNTLEGYNDRNLKKLGRFYFANELRIEKASPILKVEQVIKSGFLKENNNFLEKYFAFLEKEDLGVEN